MSGGALLAADSSMCSDHTSWAQSSHPHLSHCSPSVARLCSLALHAPLSCSRPNQHLTAGPAVLRQAVT